MKSIYMKSGSFMLAISLVVLNSCSKDAETLELNSQTLDQRSAYYRALLLDAPSRYIHYDGSGPQDDLANYNSLSTAPTTQPATCPSNVKLCWFRVTDVDQDNDVDAADFQASFEALDVNNDASNSLDDESEVTGVLEKKL